MTSKIINMMFFCGGAALGTFITTVHLYKKMEERIREIEDYYAETKGEFLRAKYTGSDEEDPPEDGSSEKEMSTHSSKKEKVNYQKFYGDDVLDDPDDEGENSDEECHDNISDQYEAWHEMHKNRPPKIIPWMEVHELPEFIDHTVLYYYQGDGVTTELDEYEDEYPIESEEDLRLLVGDCFDKFGWRDNDDDLIYVMNYAQDVCYEVQKKKGAYT